MNKHPIQVQINPADMAEEQGQEGGPKSTQVSTLLYEIFFPKLANGGGSVCCMIFDNVHMVKKISHSMYFLK